MTISLLITSNDRQSDLDRFASGLAEQTVRENVEVIFVAQGSAYFPEIQDEVRQVRLKLHNVGHPLPLSIARNIAVRDCTGDIIAFPDDDCWYPRSLLEQVSGYFMKHPEIACICTHVFDPIRKRNFGKRPYGITRRVTFANIFKLPISVGIFLRREAFSDIGAWFCEELGAGTNLGSGEETELISRLLSRGYRVQYVGTLQVYHPVEPLTAQSDPQKHYRYGYGFGVLHARFLRGGHLEVMAHLLGIALRSCIGGILPSRGVKYRKRLAGIIDGLWATLVHGKK